MAALTLGSFIAFEPVDSILLCVVTAVGRTVVGIDVVGKVKF